MPSRGRAPHGAIFGMLVSEQEWTATARLSALRCEKQREADEDAEKNQNTADAPDTRPFGQQGSHRGERITAVG
jgi:hypothetical protein